MAFCHECGSEVADNDVFCPYCGISLEPVSLGGQPASDPYDSTTMIDQPEDAATPAPEVSATAGPAESSDTDEQIKAPENESLELPAESESAGFESIPTPLFIEQAGAALKQYESEVDVADMPTDEAINLPSDTFGEHSGRQADDDEQHFVPVTGEMGPSSPKSESVLQADASQEIPSWEDSIAPPPIPVGEENATFDASGSENSLEASENTDEKVVSGDSGNIVSQPVSAAGHSPRDQGVPEPEKYIQREDPREAAKSSGNLYAEIKPFPDKGITMPREALEPATDYTSPSMFDSVRIMDSDPASGNTSSPGIESILPEPPTPTPIQETPVETAAPEENPQSFTKQNIGSSDTDGRKSSKLKPLDEGTVLNNRYEIVRKIGGGGMGAVYLASDNNLGGVLRAVKEMVQAHIEEEQQDKAINDFKRESMILSTLDHPSIPTIYDYFFDPEEGRFYLVMKYISGGDLSSRLRSAPEGKIDERTITEWAIQVADVLDYLHNRPSTIVYRDLKPSNVMLDGNTGRVMLIDFGIARSINQIEEKGVTAVGTMGYAPPELFSGNVEPRSDIYSLGSTMFHLLTGADPQNNPLLIFDFQKNPRPRQINSQLSDQIERILMHSVEYNAHSRFGSAAELRQTLEEHLENLKAGRVTYGVKEIPTSVGLANQPVFCGFCGQKIVATDMFCAFCGAKQPLAQHGVHSEIYSRSAPTARLVILGTNELDTPAFSLEKDESLVGRRDPMSNIFPEVDLSKFDPQTKISRRHAKIWRDGNSYLVEDLGSSNGTILLPVVNDSKRLAPHQPHILANGDKIRLGDTTLHFVIG